VFEIKTGDAVTSPANNKQLITYHLKKSKLWKKSSLKEKKNEKRSFVIHHSNGYAYLS
jgi:hypothetical protein